MPPLFDFFVIFWYYYIRKIPKETVMKDIKDYEGLYAITSCGQVWSYKRKRFLKPIVDAFGYARVNLSKNGKVKAHKIHRLVAEAYIPTPLGLRDVNHLDENKLNNSCLNLEWLSHKDNCNYGTRNKRIQDGNIKARS